MRLDPNPLFRRIIMPWYDSLLMCWGLLLFMIVLMLFSLAGIAVALDDPSYRRYVWVPWLLFFLCFSVACSVAIRIIRRYEQRKELDN